MARTRKFDEADKATKVTASTAKSVVIAQPKKLAVALEIEGTAPLIQNAFSQKAVEQMLRKHMGIRVEREKKKPRECIENATVRNQNGDVCVPPTAIKKAMLSAATGDKSLKKTVLRTSLFIEGQSVPLTYEKMEPRMDMVRTSGINRQPDVRFRPMFVNWKARLSVVFSDQIAVQTIVDLLNRAGTIGLGEWRPEKDGTFGTFRVSRHIDDQKEIKEVRDICDVGLVPITIPEWAMDADIDPVILEKLARGGGVSSDEEDEAPEQEE